MRVPLMVWVWVKKVMLPKYPKKRSNRSVLKNLCLQTLKFELNRIH